MSMGGSEVLLVTSLVTLNEGLKQLNLLGGGARQVSWVAPCVSPENIKKLILSGTLQTRIVVRIGILR